MHTAGGTKPCTRRLVLKRRGGGGLVNIRGKRVPPSLAPPCASALQSPGLPAARAPPPARPPACLRQPRSEETKTQACRCSLLTAFRSTTCTRRCPRSRPCTSPRAGCTRSSVCLLRTGPARGPCARRSPGCPGACGSTSWIRRRGGVRAAGCGPLEPPSELRPSGLSDSATSPPHCGAEVWGVGCGVWGGGRRGGQGSREAGWCLERAPLRSRLAPNARKLDRVGCDAYRKRADVRQNKSVPADGCHLQRCVSFAYVVKMEKRKPLSSTTSLETNHFQEEGQIKCNHIRFEQRSNWSFC